MTFVDGNVERVTCDNAGGKASSESVTSSIGVVDQRRLDGSNRIFLDLGVLAILLDGDNGGICALGNDDDSRSLGVDLGLFDHQLGRLGDADVLVSGGLSPRLGLVLVSKDVITVRDDLGKGILEELRDEAGRQTQHVDLVGLGGVFAQRQGGGRADCQMVATDVESRGGGLDLGPDLG